MGRGYSECKGPEARVSRNRRRLVCGSGMQWVRRAWRQMRVEEWIGARPHSTWGWWGETGILFQVQWEL